MAQVFIFNTGQDPTTLVLNSKPIGSVTGTSAGNRYAPSPPLAIDRGHMPEPGRFGSGGNMLQLSRPDGSAQNLRVEIGRGIRPDVDLQLWLFPQHAVLVGGGNESVYDL